jgi:outer membrane murein-binding lipoprotein Lpp
MRKILLLLFTTVLLITWWAGSHPAASQQIESRLNNLEADFNRLESQVNQLQSQLQRPTSRSTPTLPPTQRLRRNVLPQEREQMFDRLATLVVELRQQVNTLEKRVSQLESR